MSRSIPFLAALYLTVAALGAQGQQDSPGGLNLIVVQGNDFLNNNKLRTTRETILRVEDENHRPVAGAAVTFILPSNGPGGTFANGATSLVRTTAADGRVSITFQPNQLSGQFNIRATASFQGRTANVTISQTNAANPGQLARQHRFLNSKTLSIVGSAGATVGICRAAHCGGWGTDTNNVQVSNITIR